MASTNYETTPRFALVTGGSGGIGRAVSERLAADGMSVAVHYRSGSQAADETADAITARGGRAIAIAGDVSDADDMTRAFAEVESAFGGVDVVVNSAGIMALGPVAEYDLETFDRVQRVNVRGAFVVSQLAAQRLRTGGALIHFSTSVTRMHQPAYAAYAASKAAVEAMTPILARELRGRDVTVNAVAPGPTATPLFLAGKSDELIANIAAAAPMERLGTPEDIAEAVAFLAGPARWVNGQTLFANGGIA